MLKTHDPLAVVAVVADDVNIHYIAIDLLTLSSRILYSLEKKRYDAWTHLRPSVQEEVEARGEVREIVIRHSIKNNKKDTYENLEIKLKK